MSCKAIVPKTAVIVFLEMIKVIAIKLAKFLIAESLKLGHRHSRHSVRTCVSANQLFCNNFSLMIQRQCSDGIMVSFCVITALVKNENQLLKHIRLNSKLEITLRVSVILMRPLISSLEFKT